MKIKTTASQAHACNPCNEEAEAERSGVGVSLCWVESNLAERRNSGRVGKHNGYRMLKVNWPLAFSTPTSHSASKCTIELWAKTNPSSGWFCRLSVSLTYLNWYRCGMLDRQLVKTLGHRAAQQTCTLHCPKHRGQNHGSSISRPKNTFPWTTHGDGQQVTIVSASFLKLL